MAYTAQTWNNTSTGGTPISAERLTVMETGIEDADQRATALEGRQITAGTGLTGGGTLAADRTLTVTYGTSAGTATQGNDTRVVNAVQTSRQVLAGTGLTGGGTLAADRTLTVAYGSTSGTAVQGNDARVTADQAAGTASIRTLGAGAQQAAAGNDNRITGAPVALTDGTTVALNASLGKVHALVAAGNRTILTPTGSPVDGQPLIIRHTASGGARTLALTTGATGAFAFGTDITALTATTSGATDYIGCIYSSASARFHVVSYSKGFA